MVSFHRRGAEFAEVVLGVFCVLCVSAVDLKAESRRIVSTAPSITETLYALGLGDRVVGVTTFCHYPPEAAKKPKIGNYLRPDIETILSLRPDLVITERSGIRQADRLPSLKLKVLEVDDGTIPGIYDSIRRIGDATGMPGAAVALSAKIRAGLDNIRKRTAALPRRSVMFVVGRAPGRLEDIIVTGKGSYLNDVMAVAGCDNAFRDAVAAYPKITTEEVLGRNPDVIVDMGEMSETIGVTDVRKRSVVSLWGRYPKLTAVRARRVYAVASDIYVVPGPRVVEAAHAFARMAHPEAGF
jgi:iron complex transport system substrate-binding protein